MSFVIKMGLLDCVLELYKILEVVFIWIEASDGTMVYEVSKHETMVS